MKTVEKELVLLDFLEWLEIKFPNHKIEQHKSFYWSQGKIYDYYIKDLNLIIELDGIFHHKQVSNWKSPEENKINDYIKKCEHQIKKLQFIE